jgi:DNA-binding CsgD family transcriptional regulator
VGHISNATMATRLGWSCLLAVSAAVLFDLLSPLNAGTTIIVVPVVVASLLLDLRVAAATAAIACLGEFATLRFGSDLGDVVSGSTVVLLSLPVCHAVGRSLGLAWLADTHHPAPERLLARLTARETQVTRLVLEGLTAREIGDALFITDRTVESHTASAYGKLGVRDRKALVRLLRDEPLPGPVHAPRVRRVTVERPLVRERDRERTPAASRLRP